MRACPLAAEHTEHLGESGGGLRAELRAATAALHARIDRVMPLARPAPDLGDYLGHLLILRDWLAALGQALPGLRGCADEWQAVVADAELAAALTGRSTSEPTAPHAADTAALRDLDAGRLAPAARLGVRYVIEGSHLGGAVLRRRWGERLAPHPLNYLGAGGGPRWTAFLRELTARAWTPDERAAACRGAVLAFELLRRRAHAAGAVTGESAA